MNRYSWKSWPILACAAALTLLTTTAVHSQSLTLGSRVTVSENNANFNISVFDGKATYDNSGTGAYTNPPLTVGTFGDGTVLDYAFYTTKNSVLNEYANGGAGRISASAPVNLLTPSGQNWADVWTTSDPGTGFNTTKDFDAGPNPTATHAMAAQVDGLIDITGLESGQIYIPHGTFNNGWDLTLTMTGVGQTDLVALDSNGGIGNINVGYITDFSFDNTGLLYDTIALSYAHQDRDGSPGSRARFMGVILDGTAAAAPVPEPASVAIWSILGLALAGFGYHRVCRKK